VRPPRTRRSSLKENRSPMTIVYPCDSFAIRQNRLLGRSGNRLSSFVIPFGIADPATRISYFVSPGPTSEGMPEVGTPSRR